MSLLLIIAMLLSACGSDLWGTYDPYRLAHSRKNRDAHDYLRGKPHRTRSHIDTFPHFPHFHRLTTCFDSNGFTSASLTPTITPTPVTSTSVPGASTTYISQSGDSLDVVAIHFGVSPSDITSTGPLPSTGFINPGTMSVPAQPPVPDPHHPLPAHHPR